MNKLKLISIIFVLGFIIGGVNYVIAANNNETGNTIIPDNFIGSTSVTSGGSLLDQGVAVLQHPLLRNLAEFGRSRAQ